MNAKHLTIGAAVVTALAVLAAIEPALAQDATAAAAPTPASNPYGLCAHH